MDLRGGIISIYTYPTIVIFCEGRGIAAAKALVEAQSSEGGLNFPYREDVRLYYRVRLLIHLCCSAPLSLIPVCLPVLCSPLRGQHVMSSTFFFRQDDRCIGASVGGALTVPRLFGPGIKPGRAVLQG